MADTTFTIRTVMLDNEGNVVTLNGKPLDGNGQPIELPKTKIRDQPEAWLPQLLKTGGVMGAIGLIYMFWGTPITDLIESYTAANQSLVKAHDQDVEVRRATTRKINAEAAKIEAE